MLVEFYNLFLCNSEPDHIITFSSVFVFASPKKHWLIRFHTIVFIAYSAVRTPTRFHLNPHTFWYVKAFHQPCSVHANTLIVFARLAQLVRSLTANQEVPGSIASLVKDWALGDLLSPHRPWTGTLSRWSSLSTFYRGTSKNPHTCRYMSSLMPVLWSVMRATWESTSYGCKCVTLNK